ncbi:thioesterase family protein [Nisaea nitritireducens]|uniref:thioesterase family protein n=1 Tax=Nisaea nitritireducens TaxID=568392 RepID=UPI001865F8FB|nr:thioesterase family protein [Nisaea nitritireducens]
MEQVDSNKCFASGELTVQSDWVDYNGHMNVGYYVVAFDKATDALLDHLGLGASYRHERDASVFVLEAHVTYDREVVSGDGLRFTTQILDHDAKRMHVFHRMYHAVDHYLAATNELMIMHVDLKTRRSAPFPAAALERLQNLKRDHDALPRPAAAGRTIAIRRS